MTEGRAIRLRALKDACGDVCGSCGGTAGGWQREIFWHRPFPDLPPVAYHRTIIGSHIAECYARQIWSRISFEFGEMYCKPEQVKDEGK